MMTTGAVDRAVHASIADECSRSTVKNSLAVVVRVMEQAGRDGIIDRNPARVAGWQREYKLAEDELNDPRALALPSWESLVRLALALVNRSSGQFVGWGDVVLFGTAARIGEVSGVRRDDIDCGSWLWTVRRQTTPSPGRLVDKGTKGKRAPTVPMIEEIRRMVAERVRRASRPDARLFTGAAWRKDQYGGAP
jgi:integrase